MTDKWKETKANGLTGTLIPTDSRMYFRVKTSNNKFKDYLIMHPDMTVKIQDSDACLYERFDGTGQPYIDMGSDCWDEMKLIDKDYIKSVLMGNTCVSLWRKPKWSIEAVTTEPYATNGLYPMTDIRLGWVSFIFHWKWLYKLVYKRKYGKLPAYPDKDIK